MRAWHFIGAVGGLLGVWLAGATGSGERETTTRYGPDLVAYGVVNRPDGTFRRMLTQPETLDAVQAGAPLPDGTRILMETYDRPGTVGTVFHMRKRDGLWEFGSFPAERPDLATAPRASCLSCHVGAAATDLTYTRPSLDRVGAGGPPETFACNRGGRRPCDADVYAVGPG